MRHALLAAIIASSLAFGGAAMAQSYPERPIKLIVPFPPGGPTDYVARLAAQAIAMNLGTVVVENRPGAGGTLAAKAVAAAEPDGYTLLYGTSATLGIAPALYKSIDYDPLRSFAPVALVSRVPFVLGVAATLPVDTLAAFIAYAKANPGKLNYGATLGTPPHLVGELFKVTTGANIFYVPYKGAAQATTDLLAGEMQMAIEAVSTLLPHIQSGKVRALAVTSPERIPVLPDVPTMIESGYNGFPPSSWTGVVAPAGTAAPILDKLNAAINRGLQSPEIKANLARLSATAPISSPQDFTAFIAIEAPKWAALVRASGAKLDE
jgi:tripartite-type tricarboxylate transporter receptor subunit TctC